MTNPCVNTVESSMTLERCLHMAHRYAIRNTIQTSLLDAPDSALQLVPWLLLLSGSSLSCACDTAGLYAEL